MLRKWDEMPMVMKTEAVRPYYEALVRRQNALKRKRILDICGASILTIVLSPIMLGIAIAIKTEDGGPVFYRQERVTTYGKTFRIFKFRTMIMDADKKGPLVTESRDGRITKTGAKLRHLRLDELPQVFNVLAGDMSFVGTRPEVKKYVDQYTDEMQATLLLPAGVTSPASIAFKEEDKMIERYTSRGESADEAYVKYILPEKMKYNLKYLREAGVAGDMKVMVKTVLEVIK